MIDVIDDVIAHAVADYPREACGLVVAAPEGQRYIRCRNAATSKSEHFILPGKDYAAAEDVGEVIALMHSHPDASARPSDMDRVTCETYGLLCGIVSVGAQGHHDTQWLTPEGYAAPLVGRAFAYGVLDCYTLVRDWYQRERGITLPDFDRGQDQWWDKRSPTYAPDFDPYIDHMAEAQLEQVGGAPQVGDIIYMQIRSKRVNHVGVYLGDGIFLHHLYGKLSTRDVYGGYWADVTRMIVRRAA